MFPKIHSPALLSPMAGVTDVAFRALCKKYGAGMTYTEFVNGTGLVRGNVSSLNLVKTDEIEDPVAIQLFGNNIDDVIEAAKMVSSRFTVIDINCGCPAWKVIKRGAGSAMLNEPDLISNLVKKLVEAVPNPITVKIRIGIDENNINAIAVAKAVEKAGASAIAVHGRTQKQGYRGKADWKVIKAVKQAVCIPVIGNGDVFTPEDFKQKLEYSGVDAIMIGRGAIGNPYLFQQINDFLKSGKYEKKHPASYFFEYLTFAKKHEIDFKQIKSQAISFTKGIKGGAKLREQLGTCQDIEQISSVLQEVVE